MCGKCETPLMGDLVFTRDNTPISWIIRKVTGAPYSHVAVYFGKGLVLESSWKGVSLTKLSKYKEHEVVSICGTNVSRSKFIDKCLEHAGESYDYPLLLAGLFHCTFGLGSKWIKKMDNEDQWRCDELVSRCLSESGANFSGIDLLEISPGFLYDYFKNRKWEKNNGTSCSI
jgi:hypothetical protein